jgi:hypothetical protein
MNEVIQLYKDVDEKISKLLANKNKGLITDEMGELLKLKVYVQNYNGVKEENKCSIIMFR